jgi:peptide deformylase
MKLKVLTQPNPLLSEKSKKISIIDESIKKLAEDMAETMFGYGSEHESGVAIAAIQVGVPLRMTVVRQDSPKNSYYALINPEIVKGNGKIIEDMEGCLSVPKKYGKVQRFEKVKVRGINLDGKKIEIKAEGMLARILQHEIDHMNGKLFINHVKPSEVYTLTKDGQLEK